MPSGQLLLWFLRVCFGAIIIGLSMASFSNVLEISHSTFQAYAVFMGVLAAGLLIVLADLWLTNKQITTLSALYFGLLLGLLLGNILSSALDPFLFDASMESPQVRILRKGLTLLITVACCYIVISTLLQTKEEFRFIIPYVEFSKQIKGARPLVLDTSVIIDGRIADICDTRFIDTKMIVPRFVLQELQSVADSSDKLKRNRGRRGLDMLKRMQSNPKVEMQIHEGNLTELRDVQKVDERLVVMAKVLGARVVTNDFNLNKIAQLQGVEVINLNELANALKSVALPGETMMVRLVKPGDQIGQGIGYLEDGTMVVVEQGRSAIGQEVPITVTSVLQTPAGRMIFGRIEPRPAGAQVLRRTRTRARIPRALRVRDVRAAVGDAFMPRRYGFLAAGLVFGLIALLHAQTSTPPSNNAKAPTAAGNSDIEKVERVIAARREYQKSLETLRAYYISAGDIERARWAEEELLQYHRILKQSFRLELDVPPPTLQASYNIPAANEMYMQAMTYKDKGWGTDYIDNQRRAELLFQKLLSDHPQSDKISDTAYQLGDLYESRAYREYDRAAHYYERCFQWNPKTQYDARLRAARIYERSTGERSRAMEIYRDVVNREVDPKRIEEAQKRLADLSTAK